MSPIKIDHLLYGYSGTLGSYALDLADLAIRSGDPMLSRPMRMEDYPVMKRFLAREFGGGPAEDFYELKEEVDKLYGSMKQLEKDGRFDEASALASMSSEALSMRRDINKYNRKLSELRRTEQAIINSDMPIEEKEKQQDEIRDLRQAYFESINPALKEYIKLPAFRIEPLG
mgnify:FL=1